MADLTRQQLAQFQALFEQLGPLQSVSFTGVGPGGADIHQVKFEHGSLEYRIRLGPDGKVEDAKYRRQ